MWTVPEEGLQLRLWSWLVTTQYLLTVTLLRRTVCTSAVSPGRKEEGTVKKAAGVKIRVLCGKAEKLTAPTMKLMHV